MDSTTTLAQERKQAQQQVERFIRRFEPSYRLLAYHAALPLVLTPELLNCLRNQFLRGEGVPWVAEVDLLLSDLCNPVGYEQYAMDTAVRAYLLEEMERVLGKEQMEAVARLLISYVRQLDRMNPYISQKELRAQQLAAMVYLDEQRETAVRQMAEEFRDAIAPMAGRVRIDRLIDRSEMLRLARLTTELSQELAKHPELADGLIKYAKLVRDLLIDPSAIAPGEISQLYQPVRVVDVDLPSLSEVIPGWPTPVPPVRNGRQQVRPLGIGVPLSRTDNSTSGGTLGCFVRKRGKADLMILSCNHVLASVNQGSIGDPILQPGLFDGGNPTRRDRIATLAEFVPLLLGGEDRVDAAVAFLDPGIEVNLIELPGIGFLKGLYSGEILSKEVAKVGRSGTSWGRITVIELDYLRVSYGRDKYRFDGVFEIEGEGNKPFMEHGDTGSLVVDKQGYAVGLLFAGSERGGRNNKGLSYAMPIRTVLDILDLELALTLEPLSTPTLQTFEFEETFEIDVVTIAVHKSTFNAEIALKLVEQVVASKGRQLDDIKWAVLRGTIDGKTYREMAALHEYDDADLKRLATQLWRFLSDMFGEKITKTNLFNVLRRWDFPRNSIYHDCRQARQFVEDLGNGIVLEMVQIPEGSFIMGSPEDESERYSNQGPQHEVTTQPFFLGKYPVTQAQWKAVAALPQVGRELDPDPSYFKGDNRPVEQISWYDAVEFCDRLSRYTGKPYRLPSEAEWEYACRARTTTPFPFGETITTDLANYNGNYTYGSEPKGIYRAETTPVGSFGVTNAFGLYDMHGNVWDWCADHWHESYEGAPKDGSAWLTENEDHYRIMRGGSWHSLPRRCRSAYRTKSLPDRRTNRYCFRVVCAAARTL